MRPTNPRGTIHASLRHAIAVSGIKRARLARIAGCSTPASVRQLLRPDQIALTPTNTQKLQRIADAVGYRDALFVGDEDPK